MDENGVLSLGRSGAAVASSERDRARSERRQQIVTFVATHQPTSKNKIHSAVGGGRNETLALIDSMHSDELWIDDRNPTPKVWTFQGFLADLAANASTP